jgi:hypothetical protein
MLAPAAGCHACAVTRCSASAPSSSMASAFCCSPGCAGGGWGEAPRRRNLQRSAGRGARAGMRCGAQASHATHGNNQAPVHQ